MPYKASCHCGRVAIEFQAEPTMAVECNCSICSKKGALLFAVPHEGARMTADEENLGRYTFNKHAIAHRFCRTCGIHPFAEDAAETDGRSAYVNLRCVEGIDLTRITRLEFDGRSA